MQLFVDAGVPVDSRLVEWLVREVIQEQATTMLREMREGENVEGGASGEERSVFSSSQSRCVMYQISGTVTIRREHGIICHSCSGTWATL